MMNKNKPDVIVIGAGAAGLIGALELALAGRKTTVLEAGTQAGGRMLTINNPLFDKPVEAGAEFIHGDLPITLELMKKAGIKKTNVSGASWQAAAGEFTKRKEFIPGYKAVLEQMKNLPADMAVSRFLNEFLGGDEAASQREALTRYVQGYYAGNVQKASVAALYTELTTGEDNNYRIQGGYQKLVAYLQEACKKAGVEFYFSEVVTEIKWTNENVEIQTDKQKFVGRKALITVSVGVLQCESISFSPALTDKIEAAKKLGFGQVVKLNLQFANAFWKVVKNKGGPGLTNLNFLFTNEAIPTWWTQHPDDSSLLVGWLAGPPAERFSSAKKEALIELALQSLTAAFHLPQAFLQHNLLAAEWYNWSADSRFRGAYSYDVVDGETLIKKLLQPVENTLYFAGEGLHQGNQIGTVEGALASGRDVAQRLIAEDR